MCWNGKPRHLCVMTEEEARAEVKARLWRYEEARGDIDLMTAISIYSPPGENDTPRHAHCISKYSGVALDTQIKDLFSN